MGVGCEEATGSRKNAGCECVYAEVVEKGDERAIAAVSARLEDGDSAVRSAALEALVELAEKGDPHGVAVVSTYLDDCSCRVRRAAVKALVRIAEKGDKHAITAVYWHW